MPPKPKTTVKGRPRGRPRKTAQASPPPRQTPAAHGSRRSGLRSTAGVQHFVLNDAAKQVGVEYTAKGPMLKPETPADEHRLQDEYDRMSKPELVEEARKRKLEAGRIGRSNADRRDNLRRHDRERQVRAILRKIRGLRNRIERLTAATQVPDDIDHSDHESEESTYDGDLSGTPGSVDHENLPAEHGESETYENNALTGPTSGEPINIAGHVGPPTADKPPIVVQQNVTSTNTAVEQNETSTFSNKVSLTAAAIEWGMAEAPEAERRDSRGRKFLNQEYVRGDGLCLYRAFGVAFYNTQLRPQHREADALRRVQEVVGEWWQRITEETDTPESKARLDLYRALNERPLWDEASDGSQLRAELSDYHMARLSIPGSAGRHGKHRARKCWSPSTVASDVVENLSAQVRYLIHGGKEWIFGDEDMVQLLADAFDVEILVHKAHYNNPWLTFSRGLYGKRQIHLINYTSAVHYTAGFPKPGYGRYNDHVSPEADQSPRYPHDSGFGDTLDSYAHLLSRVPRDFSRTSLPPNGDGRPHQSDLTLVSVNERTRWVNRPVESGTDPTDNNTEDSQGYNANHPGCAIPPAAPFASEHEGHVSANNDAKAKAQAKQKLKEEKEKAAKKKTLDEKNKKRLAAEEEKFMNMPVIHVPHEKRRPVPFRQFNVIGDGHCMYRAFGLAFYLAGEIDVAHLELEEDRAERSVTRRVRKWWDMVVKERETPESKARRPLYSTLNEQGLRAGNIDIAKWNRYHLEEDVESPTTTVNYRSHSLATQVASTKDPKHPIWPDDYMVQLLADAYDVEVVLHSFQSSEGKDPEWITTTRGSFGRRQIHMFFYGVLQHYTFVTPLDAATVWTEHLEKGREDSRLPILWLEDAIQCTKQGHFEFRLAPDFERGADLSQPVTPVDPNIVIPEEFRALDDRIFRRPADPEDDVNQDLNGGNHGGAAHEPDDGRAGSAPDQLPEAGGSGPDPSRSPGGSKKRYSPEPDEREGSSPKKPRQYDQAGVFASLGSFVRSWISPGGEYGNDSPLNTNIAQTSQTPQDSPGSDGMSISSGPSPVTPKDTSANI